jgi:hypothetical protein
MRLAELFENAETHAISAEDMEHVYNALKKKGELDQRDVGPLAAELADEYDAFSRTKGSAEFIINRMHVLMHGMAPTGYTEHSAETFMQPARPLIAFMRNKGHDTQEAIYQAQEEAKERVAKLKREPAIKAVIDYYRQIKSSLTPQQDRIVRASKEQLTQAMMAGNKIDVVFSQVLA